jgi:Flp pilus assembly protein TadG
MKHPLTDLALRLRRFRHDQQGTTMVEFALVLPIFLLLLFALIDFGRLGFEYVMADKGMQLAARLAVARPPACAGVLQTNIRGAVAQGAVPPYYGTNCRAGGTVCANPGTITCVGAASNATVAEIWAAISPLMPSNATVANLSFTYAFDANLGFLGGPYTPMVTVKATNLTFQFATPISALAALAAGQSNDLPGSLPFPAMTVSLPAEDLALGEAG